MEQGILGIVGTGGFAREIMPIAISCFKHMDPTNIVFVETVPTETSVNGIRVLSEADFLASKGPRKFSVGIANSKIRQEITNRLIAEGATPASLRAENSTQYHCNQIGKGSLFCAYTTVTSNVTVGDGFHGNIYSYIGHDCHIGNFVTFAPRVHCNGNTHIHDHAYIGTGAVLKQGTPNSPMVIGEGAIIGMGAVVTKSVPPGVTVLGNPARDIRKLRH